MVGMPGATYPRAETEHTQLQSDEAFQKVSDRAFQKVSNRASTADFEGPVSLESRVSRGSGAPQV